MAYVDYIKIILNIKDKKFFNVNRLEIKNINSIETEIFHGTLTYIPLYCECCDCVNRNHNDIITSIKLDLMKKISESEFKVAKDTKGKMTFIIANTKKDKFSSNLQLFIIISFWLC